MESETKQQPTLRGLLISGLTCYALIEIIECNQLQELCYAPVTLSICHLFKSSQALVFVGHDMHQLEAISV